MKCQTHDEIPFCVYTFCFQVIFLNSFFSKKNIKLQRPNTCLKKESIFWSNKKLKRSNVVNFEQKHVGLILDFTIDPVAPLQKSYSKKVWKSYESEAAAPLLLFSPHQDRAFAGSPYQVLMPHWGFFFAMPRRASPSSHGPVGHFKTFSKQYQPFKISFAGMFLAKSRQKNFARLHKFTKIRHCLRNICDLPAQLYF